MTDDPASGGTAPPPGAAAGLTINIVTIFPPFFVGPLALSIPKKGGGIRQCALSPRRSCGSSRTTATAPSTTIPYGGGPGMVMRPAPFFDAVESLGATAPHRAPLAARASVHAGRRDPVQRRHRADAALCGHYKDVDQRVAEHLATEELSLGDFVLSGGEPAALAIVDAVVRLLPGAMSDLDSARGDSFYGRELSAPSYTRPPAVPHACRARGATLGGSQEDRGVAGVGRVID